MKGLPARLEYAFTAFDPLGDLSELGWGLDDVAERAQLQLGDVDRERFEAAIPRVFELRDAGLFAMAKVMDDLDLSEIQVSDARQLYESLRSHADEPPLPLPREAMLAVFAITQIGRAHGIKAYERAATPDERRALDPYRAEWTGAVPAHEEEDLARRNYEAEHAMALIEAVEAILHAESFNAIDSATRAQVRRIKGNRQRRSRYEPIRAKVEAAFLERYRDTDLDMSEITNRIVDRVLDYGDLGAMKNPRRTVYDWVRQLRRTHPKA
jgi:hypothetical protein